MVALQSSFGRCDSTSRLNSGKIRKLFSFTAILRYIEASCGPSQTRLRHSPLGMSYAVAGQRNGISFALSRDVRDKGLITVDCISSDLDVQTYSRDNSARGASASSRLRALGVSATKSQASSSCVNRFCRTSLLREFPVPTFHQLVKQGRTPTRYKTASPALQGSPQRRGVCTRVYTHRLPRSQILRCAR